MRARQRWVEQFLVAALQSRSHEHRQIRRVTRLRQRQWVAYQDIWVDDSDFEFIGADFARETSLERRGRVGNATALLLPQRPLVDYAVGWMERNRK